MKKGELTMPIVIRKSAAKRHPAPEPLVPRPLEHAAPTPREAFPHLLPVAVSPEQLRAHPGAFRAPAPTDCCHCGHSYAWPCHGKSDRCMNRRFIDERR
jgi:hypothetical protein